MRSWLSTNIARRRLVFPQSEVGVAWRLASLSIKGEKVVEIEGEIEEVIAGVIVV